METFPQSHRDLRGLYCVHQRNTRCFRFRYSRFSSISSKTRHLNASRRRIGHRSAPGVNARCCSEIPRRPPIFGQQLEFGGTSSSIELGGLASIVANDRTSSVVKKQTTRSGTELIQGRGDSGIESNANSLEPAVFPRRHTLRRE